MLEETARDKEKLVQKVSDGTSVISYISSQYETGINAVITQEQESVKIIRDLQKLAMGMSLLYLFISIIAITYAALKQYRPMQRIVSELKKQETGEEGQEHSDEFAYISQSIQNLVNKNREISTAQNSSKRDQQGNIPPALTEPDAVSTIDTRLWSGWGSVRRKNRGGPDISLPAYRRQRAFTGRYTFRNQGNVLVYSSECYGGKSI